MTSILLRSMLSQKSSRVGIALRSDEERPLSIRAKGQSEGVGRNASTPVCRSSLVARFLEFDLYPKRLISQIRTDG